MGHRLEGAKADDGARLSVPLVRSMGVDPPHTLKEEDPAYIRELADSIFSLGQEVPIAYRLDASRRPWVMAGRCRRLAVLFINDHPELYEISASLMRDYGGFPLRGKFLNATESQSIDYALTENLLRRFGPIDLMMTALHMTEVLGMSQKDVAERLSVGERKLSASTICNLLALVPLPKAILLEVNRGKLPASAARQLLGLPAESLDAFASRLLAGEKPSDLMREMRQARRDAGQRRARSRAEFRKELSGIDHPLARALGAYLDGNPGAGSLISIVVEEGLRRQGVETRVAERLESEAAA